MRDEAQVKDAMGYLREKLMHLSPYSVTIKKYTHLVNDYYLEFPANYKSPAVSITATAQAGHYVIKDVTVNAFGLEAIRFKGDADTAESYAVNQIVTDKLKEIVKESISYKYGAGRRDSNLITLTSWLKDGPPEM